MSAPREAPSAESAVKRLQFWAALAFGVAGVGFFGAMYLNRYAQASDLERLSSHFNEHVVSESSRVSAVEERAKNMEDDVHWLRDQISRIAESVGAERVPLPKH